MLLFPPEWRAFTTTFTFHRQSSVSRKHLHRYVAESDFQWNARKIDDGARTAMAIKNATGKRLRYRDGELATQQGTTLGRYRRWRSDRVYD